MKKQIIVSHNTHTHIIILSVLTHPIFLVTPPSSPNKITNTHSIFITEMPPISKYDGMIGNNIAKKQAMSIYLILNGFTFSPPLNCF